MLNDEIKKKINFKKGQKKNHSQLMLTFETCDVVIRLRLIVQKAKPKNNEVKFSMNKMLSNETKKNKEIKQ